MKIHEFAGNTKVQVVFTKGRMYFRTKPGYVQLLPYQRKYLRGKSIRIDETWFPWSCAYGFAESVLEQNASLRANDVEVEYLNDAPVCFYRTGSGTKTYKGLSYACIKAFVLAGNELEKMVTNFKEMDTNMLGYAIPVLRTAHLYVISGKEGRIGVEGFSEEDIKKILGYAQRLKEDRSIGFYTQKWLVDVFIPALTGYLDGLNMAEEDFESIRTAYSQKVEKVNSLLKQHSSEFDFSDEDVFQFDCGFITIGFTDAQLSKQRMVLVNDTRTKYATPEIQLPKTVQSLAVQCREFEKAKRIVKRELGLDIEILESHLD